MITVYLDWNVMAQMKGGFLGALHDILFQRDRFFVPYSTSHIGDILSSYVENDQAQEKRIEADLDFITSITNNQCLSNNGKQIVLDTTPPHSIFQQRINDSDLLNDFDIEKIAELFNVEGVPKGLGDMFTTALKSIPMDDSFNTALQNPESKEIIQKVFPDLGENPTMEDFIRSFANMVKNLNEEEGYKDLRKITQSGLGINRDKIFNDNDPKHIIDNAHSKVGFKFNEFVDLSKYAPEWYNRITNEYLKLDMHGYQEDKVEVKPNKRKQTFANMIKDAAHAAFAATCEFYITNDNKSYHKTKMVYEHLGITTTVVKPQEFIDAINGS
jgi:hypothetical protein